MISSNIHGQYHYPFGMVMPGREHTGPENYRYGFNGQEKDDEVKGENNSLAFTYRIHDPRLGRFLSMDPLMKEFTGNSPYAFCENDVIQAIELEGGEKLIKNVYTDPTLDGSGKAKITIVLDYIVVKQGVGNVNENIDPKIFKARYDMGDGTFYMTKLPSKDSPGEFLTGRFKKWAIKAEEGSARAKGKLKKKGIKYYVTEIDYEYTVKDGNTLEDAIEWKNKDIAGRGIIFNGVDEKDLEKVVDLEAKQTAVIAQRKFTNDPSIGGMGLNTSVDGAVSNLIILNQNTTMKMSATIRAVHEAGHNSAKVHVHDTGDYEYDQAGLQSNIESLVMPSRKNTSTIVNDQGNRQTIND